MNYTILDINKYINKIVNKYSSEEIHQILGGKTNENFSSHINPIMNEIIDKKKLCKDLIKQQEDKQIKLSELFAETALVIQFLKEAQSYLIKIKNEIIDKENTIASILLTLGNMTEYNLNVLKEIYVMSMNNCFLGAMGRYRVFLETYCIFLYFIKYPDAIVRFMDHFTLRDYKSKRRAKLEIDDTKKYNELRKKYGPEYTNFCKNYGWACHTLNNPNSIKELFKYAFDDNDYHFINTEYNKVSDYSHASLNIAMKKKLSIDEVPDFLVRSGELSITSMQFYILWIMDISDKNDKRLCLLIEMLQNLKNTIYEKYHGKENQR